MEHNTATKTQTTVRFVIVSTPLKQIAKQDAGNSASDASTEEAFARSVASPITIILMNITLLTNILDHGPLMNLAREMILFQSVCGRLVVTQLEKHASSM